MDHAIISQEQGKIIIYSHLKPRKMLTGGDAFLSNI